MKSAFIQTVKDYKKKQYILPHHLLYLEKNRHSFRHKISSSGQCIYVSICIGISICKVFVHLVLFKILHLLTDDPLLCALETYIFQERCFVTSVLHVLLKELI